MTDVEFAQYKSELQVEESGRGGKARLSVVGRLRVKDRRGDNAEVFVFIHIPAWKDEALFMPGGALYANKAFKKKGEWLELEEETVMREGEALEAFWHRCREKTKKALAWGGAEASLNNVTTQLKMFNRLRRVVMLRVSE